MPDVGVLGDQAQGLLLPASADQYGDVTRRLWVQLREPGFDAGKRGREIVEPASRGTELIAVSS